MALFILIGQPEVQDPLYARISSMEHQCSLMDKLTSRLWPDCTQVIVAE